MQLIVPPCFKNRVFQYPGTMPFLSHRVDLIKCLPEANHNQGPVSRKSRELFGPEKPVFKLQSACFQRLVLKHVFNVRRTKRVAKFDGLEPWLCEDEKGTVAAETGAYFSKSRNFSGLFRVPQFPLYLRNAEVLSHQTSQSSWFFLH